MEIITLKGDDGAGKTKVITQIFEELFTQREIDGAFYVKSEGADNQEFKALLKYNGKKIAFCSIGDPADFNEKTKYEHLPSEYILSGLVFASKNEADVLINAYRTQFSEFPESVYKALLGNNKYSPIPISTQSNLSDVKDQIIAKL